MMPAIQRFIREHWLVCQCFYVCVHYPYVRSADSTNALALAVEFSSMWGWRKKILSSTGTHLWIRGHSTLPLWQQWLIYNACLHNRCTSDLFLKTFCGQGSLCVGDPSSICHSSITAPNINWFNYNYEILSSVWSHVRPTTTKMPGICLFTLTIRNSSCIEQDKHGSLASHLGLW